MTNQETETKDGPQRTAPRSALTLTQLAATGLAAVTAAFLGSFIGTTGTVVGAGLASVTTSLSTAVYQRYLDRTRNRVRSTVSQVRRVRPATTDTTVESPASPPDGEPTRFTGKPPSPDAPTRRLEPADRPPVRARKVRWPIVAAVTAVTFLLGIGVVTGVELLKGGPISGGDNGTSVGHLFGQPTDRATTDDTPTPATGSKPTSETSTATTTRQPDTTTPTPTVGQAPPPPSGGATTTTPPATTAEQPPSNPSLPAQPG